MVYAPKMNKTKKSYPQNKQLLWTELDKYTHSKHQNTISLDLPERKNRKGGIVVEKKQAITRSRSVTTTVALTQRWAVGLNLVRMRALSDKGM